MGHSVIFTDKAGCNGKWQDIDIACMVLADKAECEVAALRHSAVFMNKAEHGTCSEAKHYVERRASGKLNERAAHSQPYVCPLNRAILTNMCIMQANLKILIAS